jgi:hypothetical protein
MPSPLRSTAVRMDYFGFDVANAERVCRQDCVGPVCQERCAETEGRGDRREGREYRREDRRELREERRERGPGIELRVPGVEIGR